MKLAQLLREDCLSGGQIRYLERFEARLPEVSISGVHFDSRRVKPGSLFVCIPGFQSDGHDHAPQAVSLGACALLVERYLDTVPEDVIQIRVEETRPCLGPLAAALYEHPSFRLATVGITGTNGKTSTAYLCEAVLEKAGQAPGLIGTIRARVGDEERPVRNTTPEASELQELLHDMVGGGNRSVVMEVSSHALALHRVNGIPFDVAVFTNLTQDHLDFHGSMEEYFAVKRSLFTGLGRDWSRQAPPYAVINIDDPYGRQILDGLKVPYITYGFSPEAHVRACDLEFGPEGSRFTVKTPVGKAKVTLHLAGAFNVLNALAALGVGLARRIELEEAVSALSHMAGIPGRFELVREGQDFTVLVDYAHTPDGLSNVLKAAREITDGRLCVVFGCGGDRDQSKRSPMGRIAAQLADRVVLTSDNPRNEDPRSILEQIEVGVLEGCPEADYHLELDREAAIHSATRGARPGDTVVIAGKGHERYQIFADHKVNFDDREVAKKAIRDRLGKTRPHGFRTANLLWTEARRNLNGRGQTRSESVLGGRAVL